MASVKLIIPTAKYSPSLNYECFVRTPLEGITSLRSCLLEAGHDVNIVDCRSEVDGIEWTIEGVTDDGDLIGFTTFYDSFAFIEESIRILRKIYKKALYVVGGPLATSAPEAFLCAAGVDVVVVGEGEKALLELAAVVDAEEDISTVPGIWYRNSTNSSVFSGPGEIFENLDNLPDLDWSYLDKSTTTGDFGFMCSAGRGCNQKCSYCTRALGNRRFRSPEKLRSELAYLKDEFGMDSIILNDVDFLHENHYLESFCDVFSNLSLTWACFTAPRNLDPQMLDVLYSHGCVNLRVGIETFDEKLLEVHRPDFTLSEMLQVLDILEESPIPKITCYFLLGLPGQTAKSIEDMLEEVDKRKRIVPRPFYLIPIPGTRVFEFAKAAGMVKSVPEYLRTLSHIRADSLSEDHPILSTASVNDLKAGYDTLFSWARLRKESIDCSIQA